MDRLAEMDEYDGMFGRRLVDDDFLAAGYTPQEIQAYRGAIVQPSLTAQDRAAMEAQYGVLEAPDLTLRQRSAARVQDRLIREGIDPYVAGSYSRRIVGDTAPTDGGLGIGLADFTPLGMVFGTQEGARTAVQGYQQGDPVQMGLGALEAGLGILEATPLTAAIGRGIAATARRMDPNTLYSVFGPPVSARPPLRAPETGSGAGGRSDPAIERGQEIMQMLRSGRASEVTDDMLDMGDPTLNARLNMYLYDNYDLPMDEASRMARAGDTDAFHATRSTENFSQFRPGARGSIYMAATPEGAARGAAGQALEVAASNPISGTTAIMPLRINSGDVRGLTVNQSAYDALPDVLTESDVPAMAGRIKEAGLEYWDDAYEAVRFGDEYRYYKRDAPTARYQDLEPGKDAWGYRLGAFNTGSDLDSLARSADMGKRGFMVADEGGSSIVAGIDMPLRSRFARFDPRLAHLRNLSAGVGGAAVLTALAEDAEAGTPEAQIMGLVQQSGISGAAEALGVSPRDIEQAMAIVAPQTQRSGKVAGPQ